MTWSFLLPSQPESPDVVRRFAPLADGGGYSRMWLGQSFRIESHLAAAALVGHRPVPIGFGTALAALRTPYDAAMQARSLAAVLERDVAIGYGAADAAFVASMRGTPFAKPASYMAGYASAMRALLRGEPVAVDHAECRVIGQLPPLEHPPVSVGLGVLRRGMARKAADSADFVVTWLTPPEYLRDVIVPAVTRPDGTRPRIVTYVQCAVAAPERNPLVLAQLSCGNHLGKHHYVEMLRACGLQVDLADPIGSVHEVVDAGVFVYGTPDEIAARLAGYRAAGADEVVVNPTAVALGIGEDACLADLDLIASALPASAPSHQQMCAVPVSGGLL